MYEVSFLWNWKWIFLNLIFRRYWRDGLSYHSLKRKVISAWDSEKTLRCLSFGPTISGTVIWNGPECIGFGSHDYSLAIYCWNFFLSKYLLNPVHMVPFWGVREHHLKAQLTERKSRPSCWFQLELGSPGTHFNNA